MVTFTNAGRMGNWCFEAATSIAYALEHNLEFTVPKHTDNEKWNPIYCLHLVNPNYNPHLEKIHLWETKHSYEELPFDESWIDKNICIEGYRQTALYFDKYRNHILYLFDFPYTKKESFVSVHVRRGDYLELRMKHKEVTVDWYYRAMDLFKGYTFKFFSDDIPWCMKTFGHLSNVEFSSNSDEVTDMIEMSCMEHQICSPSTFSWWGAYLNQNEDKKVVFPTFWFTEGWGGLDTSQIVKPEWIKLP
jgi:Glycosyl transferase family 11